MPLAHYFRDGKLWIMTKRQKTGVESNIMLFDIPKQIIEKYDGMRIFKDEVQQGGRTGRKV